MIWRRLIEQLGSISEDRHLQLIPTSLTWRDGMPLLVERHLRASAQDRQVAMRERIERGAGLRGLS